MRISGGEAKGTKLKVPKGARPASERVRQAIFSSLGDRVAGARVLDLYCGSGAYGLEALSRGAESAVLVDKDLGAVAATRDNSCAAKVGDDVRIRRSDVERYLRREAAKDGPFDLVFVDPPYIATGHRGLLEALRQALNPSGRVVLETRSTPEEPETPSGWVLEADRRYGDTRVQTFRRAGDTGES
jgi:16S rRNA (guanine966-N2)-methyltransferase